MRNLSKMTVLPALLALTAIFAIQGVQADEKHSHKKDGGPKEVTLQGEVLDLYCYMKHPEDGQGPDHVKCAKTCIRKGLPIGFLADGEVYLLLGKDHESAADLVVDFAGVESRLTGMLIEHAGVKSIEVIKIEPVKASKG